jgi:nitroimidazol reductase NimA-like FMN-containing flavoprotein (pyridoxamine 5'-phosphate oxidase superfamily)
MSIGARELRAITGTEGPVGEVSVEHCWKAIESAELGRLAVVDPEHGPRIFPLNFAVDGTAILFRTAPGSKLDALTHNSEVAFEIDEFDDEAAYSVVVSGRAERLESPTEIEAAEALPLHPWIPTLKLRWVRIRPTEVTGRVFLRGAEPNPYV